MVDDAEVEFSHHMQVTRIHESPRVTKPYTEEQWAQVLALGEAVDRELQAGDVRLTMGGEPTFVAVDDRDAAEWNTDALGPTKRGLRHRTGAQAARRIRPGRLPAFRPGQVVPRRAVAALGAVDLLARRRPAGLEEPRAVRRRTPARAATPARTPSASSHALAGRLGLTDQFIQPGYEDVFYYLWRERRLPVNVDPFDSRLDDEMERVRLRRVFEQKLDARGRLRAAAAAPATRRADASAARAGPPAPGSCATSACT